MAFNTVSKRFKKVLVILLLATIPVLAVDNSEPSPVDICAGEGIGMFTGGHSGYTFLMPTVYTRADGKRRYCGLGAMYSYRGVWNSYSGYKCFQWDDQGGGRWYLDGSWSGNNPESFYISCSESPDYDKFLNGGPYSPPDDLDLLDEYINGINNPLLDEDHDGIPDQMDKDCPLHDEYLNSLGKKMFGEDYNGTGWTSAYGYHDDPFDYKQWQEDPAAWNDNWDNKRNIDSDGDGFSDGWEETHGYDPLDASSKAPGTGDFDSGIDIFNPIGDNGAGNWRLNDSDGDGFTDGLEWDNGYNWLNPNDYPAEIFEPDWNDLDYDGDGESNIDEVSPLIPTPTDTNPNPIAPPATDPTDPDDHHDGFSPGGYSGDGTGDTNNDAPEEDDIYEEPEDYQPGNYTINPSTFNFGDEDYDNMLGRFDKIRGNWEALRPDNQRDYSINLRIPFPGAGVQEYKISIVPDLSTPMGNAVDQFRKWIRMLFVALMTYWLIRNIWTTLRQY